MAQVNFNYALRTKFEQQVPLPAPWLPLLPVERVQGQTMTLSLSSAPVPPLQCPDCGESECWRPLEACKAAVAGRGGLSFRSLSAPGARLRGAGCCAVLGGAFLHCTACVRALTCLCR